MIQVCGHRVLVRPYTKELFDPVYAAAKAQGIQVILENEKRVSASVDKGFVLSIGPSAWKDFGGEPWCKVGDTVIWAKHAHKVVEDPETKEELGILNDEDIVAVIKE
jgi:co-chaperonin GroES (HSP10)